MSDLQKEPSKEVVEIARKVSARKKRAPNVYITKGENRATLTIGESGEPDQHLLLMEALGTYDLEFLTPLLSQLGNATAVRGEAQQEALQFVVSFIKSIEPESEVETLLATQMATVHICAMNASQRYFHTDTLAGKDSAERALTKLTRTYAAQMETLKRYRSKAEQTVRVERVNVESGGQAIVGDVSHRGEG